MKPLTSCRHFLGDRPCGRSSICSDQCPAREVPSSRILLVHLGALGAVVRSTSLIAPLRRRHPGCHLTWVTDAPADRILRGHPRIDRVLATSESDLLALSTLEFDLAYVVDKSLKAGGVLRRTEVDVVRGFVVDSTGAILPATPAARELWEIGLDNDRKFHVNRKPETRLLTEALELGPWRRDEYDLPLTKEESVERQERHRLWSGPENRPVVGINTGCSPQMAMKKLTIDAHVRLIEMLNESGVSCVLLGGPEDTGRNAEIARRSTKVHRSPEDRGLRDGLVSVAACDAVVTGDSLGLHLAVSQKRWVIAWFGATCAHEIDLYDRGESVLSKATCGPCWKRSCQKDPMCYDLVDLQEIVAATLRGLRRCPTKTSAEPSSSRPPFSETSSSPSR